ncbi:hypothetical protein ACM66B_000194 [Microbotryomycetes sp. NB124-2]
MVTKRVSIAAQGTAYSHVSGSDQPHQSTSVHDDEQTATSTQVSPLAARRISMRIPGLPSTTTSASAMTNASPTRLGGGGVASHHQQPNHYHSKSYYGLPDRSMSMSVMSRYNSTPPSSAQTILNKLKHVVDSSVWFSKRWSASPVKKIVVLVACACLVVLIVLRVSFNRHGSGSSKTTSLSEDEIVDQVLKQAASMGTYTLDNAHLSEATVTANRFERVRPVAPQQQQQQQQPGGANKIVGGGGQGFRKMARPDVDRVGKVGSGGARKGNKPVKYVEEEEDEDEGSLSQLEEDELDDEEVDDGADAPKRPEIHHPDPVSTEDDEYENPTRQRGGRRKPAAGGGEDNRGFRLKDSDDVDGYGTSDDNEPVAARPKRPGKPLKDEGGVGSGSGAARGGGKRVKQLGRPLKEPPAPAGQAGDQGDEWNNAGWHQRFKQKGPGGAGSPGDGTKASGGQVPSLMAKYLGHPLVSRYAGLDLQGGARHSSAPAPTNQRYNLTVCAILPGESRFLQEWLIYHRLLGVDRIVLYDTTARGAQGAAEVEALVGKLSKEQIVGNAANNAEQQKQVAEEIKARVEGGGAHALDKDGKIEPERIAGLERWLLTGSVVVNHMSFRTSKKSKSFNEHFLKHCIEQYSSSTEWLAQLDVDEFLTMSEPLYGPSAPYQDGARAISSSSFPPVNSNPWRYPLHDLLQRDSTRDAACVVVPQLRYRNWGRRQLDPQDSVVDVQTRRDVITHDTMPAKAFLHSSFSKDIVTFDAANLAGANSCEVTALPKELPDGLTDAIKTSQGQVLQEGGTYKESRLPTEPLAVAHYVQRDLADCISKLGTVDDPNSVREKSRGVVSCEQQYLPSPEEMASEAWLTDKRNRFLAKTPSEGTIVDDPRVRDSWTAKATKAILYKWKKLAPVDPKSVEEARDLVKVVYI